MVTFQVLEEGGVWRIRSAMVAGAVFAICALRAAQIRWTGLSRAAIAGPSDQPESGALAEPLLVMPARCVPPLSQMTGALG